MTHKSADEYMKNRIRLTPETLTYKYAGLFFGWPLLILVTLGLQWASAVLALRLGIYDADTIITWRNIFHGITVASGILSVIFNLGDTGKGPLCTVGRIVMPLADALYVGKPLRRFAHRQARRNPRAEYEAYLARSRKRETEAKERREQTAVNGPYYSLPWNRKADPFLIRRCVEATLTIGEMAAYWVIVILFWDTVPFFLAAFFAVLVSIVTVLAAIVLVLMLMTTKPEDDLFKKADWLIARLQRMRR